MSEATLPVPPEAAAVAGPAVAAAQAKLAELQALIVDSPVMADIVTEEMNAIKARRAQLEERRMGYTRPLDQVKTALIDLFRPAVDALAQGETICKQKLGAWFQQCERERLAEQARLEAAAREEREKLEAKAKEAEAAGRVEDAAASRQVAELIVAPAVSAPAAIPSKGATIQSRWTMEVTSLEQLVAWIAFGEAAGFPGDDGKAPKLAHPEMLQVLQADEVTLRRLAVALKKDAPFNGHGVRVFERPQVAGRRK